MSLRLYMDVHVPAAITEGVRSRGVDVLTSQEDGTRSFPDPELLDRAEALGHILFTQDTDLLREATRRQRSRETFAGVVFARQRGVSIGRCVGDLVLLSSLCEPEDLANSVHFLPLR